MVACTRVMTVVLIIGVNILPGAFLDTMAMVILSIPTLFPIISGMGLDPIRFGIIAVIEVEQAPITPPMGINVSVARGLATDVSLAQVFLGVLSFCTDKVASVALVVAASEIVTVPPPLGR